MFPVPYYVAQLFFIGAIPVSYSWQMLPVSGGKNISTYIGQLSLRHHLKIYFQNIVAMSSVLHHWFLSPRLTSVISAASFALDIFMDSNL
jgi:hypothetical protein